MLAPFFVNLLMWCVLMLFVGWALDVINGWIDSARHGAMLFNRASRPGPARRFKPNRTAFASVVTCPATRCFVHGMTKRPEECVR